MKIGTLQCKIFGHKFVYQIQKLNESGYVSHYEPVQTDFCVRCGKEKSPENTVNIEDTKDNLARN